MSLSHIEHCSLNNKQINWKERTTVDICTIKTLGNTRRKIGWNAKMKPTIQMYLKFSVPFNIERGTWKAQYRVHLHYQSAWPSEHSWNILPNSNTTKILLRASSIFTKIDHILLIKPFLINTILNHGNLLFDINRKK